ncbi:MAG: hypothetical protein JST00_46330 [Deltaproteobacteria bacterium]|nr:hypothetical protein [Deltaproteobacteria bacterium]
MLTAAAGMATLLATNVAFADERADCASAADQAQQLRDEGKYRRAREQLLICARDVCPAPIKRDCLDWLSQMESVAPTVVLGAKDGTRDLIDVKVSVDGMPLTEKLDGKPVPMDLGQHTFKFEYQGQVKEETVVIGAGQKGRNIAVVFGGAGAGAQGGTPPAQKTGGGSGREEPSLVPALVVGGIGVVGLVSFTIFGLSGKSEVSDLETTCKPNCKESDVDAARTKLIVADISLGIGVVALAVATYMILSRPKVDAQARAIVPAPEPRKKSALSNVTLDVAPTRGGGAFGAVGLTF